MALSLRVVALVACALAAPGVLAGGGSTGSWGLPVPAAFGRMLAQLMLWVSMEPDGSAGLSTTDAADGRPYRRIVHRGSGTHPFWRDSFESNAREGVVPERDYPAIGWSLPHWSKVEEAMSTAATQNAQLVMHQETSSLTKL